MLGRVGSLKPKRSCCLRLGANFPKIKFDNGKGYSLCIILVRSPHLNHDNTFHSPEADTLLVAHQFALEDALNTRDPSIIRRTQKSRLKYCTLTKSDTGCRLFALPAFGQTHPEFVP